MLSQKNDNIFKYIQQVCKPYTEMCNAYGKELWDKFPSDYKSVHIVNYWIQFMYRYLNRIQPLMFVYALLLFICFFFLFKNSECTAAGVQWGENTGVKLSSISLKWSVEWRFHY